MGEGKPGRGKSTCKGPEAGQGAVFRSYKQLQYCQSIKAQGGVMANFMGQLGGCLGDMINI